MADRTKRHREAPLKRTNPSGKTVWVARYTGPDGVRRLVKPQATFPTRREAQDAIDAAYDSPTSAPETLGAYEKTWLKRWPRSERTNQTNTHRLSRVLDVEIEGRPLRDWPYRELRRRHAIDLVEVLLTDQGRAHEGAVGILRVLSAMTENAITDEIAEVNAFKGVRVKANDPRILKARREPRVFSFDELHHFASCARSIVGIDPRTNEPYKGENAVPRNYEALVRTFVDTGRRLGAILSLERRQLVDGVFHFEGTAHNGVVTGDSGTKKHTGLVPATDRLLELIDELPPRIDTRLMFPTPTGKLWAERNFYRDVWEPTRRASGMDLTPHDCRHSFVSNLAAAGIDEADLCEIVGQSPETMRKHYRHALGRSFDQVRAAIG